MTRIRLMFPPLLLVLIILLSACTADTLLQPAALSDMVVGVQSSSLYSSPYTWRKTTRFFETNNTGAYLKLGFTGPYIKAKFDTSVFDTTGAPARNYPRVRATVDGVSKDFQLSKGSPTLTLASGLSSGRHTLKLGFVSTAVGYDRWEKPVNVVRVASFYINQGATTFKPSVQSKRMLLFADSHGEGFSVNSDRSHDAFKAFGAKVASNLGAELGNVAFAGQGWATGGGGRVPNLYGVNGTWNKLSANYTRLPLSPTPEYVLMVHGHNDYTKATPDAEVRSRALAWLRDMRRAAPNAAVFLVIPCKGFERAPLTAAHSDYRQTHPGDVKTYLIDLGAEAETLVLNNSNDGGNHMNATGQLKMATLLASAVRQKLDSVLRAR